ncbi:GntR family transcriptional regulator, partial [Pseudomonas viridiflava]|uniref:GntR family transcriptional regulator n=1 Tax=Pseudomonas viridiflava TaxID=33069 RepID=UPI000F05F494
MSDQITGTTAADIADSVRGLSERGALRAGSPLPPVLELATTLGVNRNTAVDAYRQLAQAGLVISRGRAGTVIAGLESVAQEGYASDTV